MCIRDRCEEEQKALLSKNEGYKKKIAELENENTIIQYQIGKLESKSKEDNANNSFLNTELKKHMRLAEDLTQQLEDKTKECKNTAKKLQEYVAENAKLWKTVNEKNSEGIKQESYERKCRAEALGGSETDRIQNALIKSANATINEMMKREQNHIKAVSYTHLTLPTICSV
eukprot:TRINITY_DN15228_c0_g1_i2.p1 TRINITY_DN15228_c0_g1~~TRINITY_DN15228_c0_g1_i2.p1  ORF type:complete len:172 (+),score=52.06 TRINITY_DN15228_c0_g1_i2:87-602(+)